jgi:hypothetical protein
VKFPGSSAGSKAISAGETVERLGAGTGEGEGAGDTVAGDVHPVTARRMKTAMNSIMVLR